MKKLTFLKLTCYSLCLIVFASFYSCKKSSTEGNTPEEVNEPKTDGKYFEINFNNQTIELNKVESVNAEFKSVTNNDFIRQLKKGENSFYLDKSDLPNGIWEVTITIYTSFDAGSRRKYITKKNLSTSSSNLFIAPIIKADNYWKPFIIVGSEDAGLEIIFSERQDDPLFEINTFTSGEYEHLYLDRISFNEANFQVDADSWQQTAEKIPDYIVNTNALAAYSERIKTKQWHASEILLLLVNKAGQDKTLYYKYINRYKN